MTGAGRDEIADPAGVGDEPGHDRSGSGPAAAPSHGESVEALETELYLQSRAGGRDPRRLPVLLLAAVVLVWRTNRRSTIGVVAFQLSSAALAAVQVFVAGYAVQELIRGGLGAITGRLVLALALLALVTVVGGLTGTAGTQLGRVLGLEVTRRVTDDVLDITTSVELVQYDDARFHDQLNRVLANMPTKPYEVITAGATLVGGVFGTITLVVSLAVIHPLLVVVVVLVGLPLWLTSRRGGTLEFQMAVEQTTGVRERDYLVDLLTRRENAAEMRAFGTARLFRNRFAAFYDDYVRAVRTLVRRRYVLSGIGNLLAGVAALLTLLLLFWLVSQGRVDVSRAAAALVAIRLIVGRAAMLAEGAGSLFESALFLEDYRTFVGRVDGRDEDGDHDPARIQRRADGEIVLEGACFAYPDVTRNAVDDVTLRIRAGETVALVGENGSGKSTLAKILGGLYVPTAGTVTWSQRDGVAVARRDAAASTSLVFQDFLRYQLTLADNIALGRPDDVVDTVRVRDAARRAAVDSVARDLPHGYDTRLSRLFAGGRDLSLGQWQRVALARTYYRDTPVVILDEPASALDPRAEAALYESVNEVLRDRTVVMVTHRLRSVRQVDRILVMHRGKIVEDGDHASLIAGGGHYAELFALQDRIGVGARPADMSSSDVNPILRT